MSETTASSALHIPACTEDGFTDSIHCEMKENQLTVSAQIHFPQKSHKVSKTSSHVQAVAWSILQFIVVLIFRTCRPAVKTTRGV